MSKEDALSKFHKFLGKHLAHLRPNDIEHMMRAALDQMSGLPDVIAARIRVPYDDVTNVVFHSPHDAAYVGVKKHPDGTRSYAVHEHLGISEVEHPVLTGPVLAIRTSRHTRDLALARQEEEGVRYWWGPSFHGMLPWPFGANEECLAKFCPIQGADGNVLKRFFLLAPKQGRGWLVEEDGSGTKEEEITFEPRQPGNYWVCDIHAGHLCTWEYSHESGENARVRFHADGWTSPWSRRLFLGTYGDDYIGPLRYLSVDDGTFAVRDAFTGKNEQSYRGTDKQVWEVGDHRDGHFLLTGYSGSVMNQPRFTDVESGWKIGEADSPFGNTYSSGTYAHHLGDDRIAVIGYGPSRITHVGTLDIGICERKPGEKPIFHHFNIGGKRPYTWINVVRPIRRRLVLHVTTPRGEGIQFADQGPDSPVFPLYGPLDRLVPVKSGPDSEDLMTWQFEKGILTIVRYR